MNGHEFSRPRVISVLHRHDQQGPLRFYRQNALVSLGARAEELERRRMDGRVRAAGEGLAGRVTGRTIPVSVGARTRIIRLWWTHRVERRTCFSGTWV